MTEPNAQEVEPTVSDVVEGVLDADDGDEDVVETSGDTKVEEPAAEEPPVPEEPEGKEGEKPEEVKAEPEPEKETKAPEKEPIKEEPKEEVKVEPVKEEVKLEPQPTREEQLAALEKQREDMRTTVAERYKLTEEQAELLRDDPAEAFPKLMAIAYVDLYEAMFHGIMEQIPNMVAMHVAQHSSNTQVESKFYDAFPELNNPQYIDQLKAVAALFKQQHPNASAEEVIEGVGRTAMAMLGIQRAVEVKEPDPPAPKPKMPSVPATAQTSAGAAPDKPDVSDDILGVLDFEEPDV